MNRKPLILLVLILVLAPVVVPGQRNAPDNEKLSEQEKRELITFTKRFVARMQTTRHVAPLLKEYFLPMGDIMAFWTRELEEQEYAPTAAEGKRLTLAWFNYVYLMSLSMIMQGDEEFGFEFKSILPPRVARALDKNFDSLSNALEDKSGRSLRALLPRLEANLKIAQSHLRKKKYERTAKYKAGIADRMKHAFYNYEIEGESCDKENDKDSLACWVQRFGRDARLYNVGMPHGIAPAVVKLRSGYKILFIIPHPMSGD